MDEFKEEIRKRAGSSSSGYFYRGAGVEETRSILDHRRLDGDEYPVWWVDNTPEEIDDARPSRVSDKLDVVDREDIPLTGGISSSIPGAAKFSQSLSTLGVVLVFSPENLDQKPSPITYDLEWFDDNAGVAARVASLVNGEVRTASDGMIHGLVRSDGVIDSTGRENLELKFDTPMYTDEQEWFVVDDHLRLDGAIEGAVTVAHTNRAVGGSAQGALAEYPSYTMAFAGGGQTNVNNMTDENLAGELHEMLTDVSGLALEVDTPYYVVLMDDDRWKQGAGFDTSEFLLAHDGERAITDADLLPRWLPI